MGHGSAIVVDIGKTLGKVTLWSRDGRLLDRQVRLDALGKYRCEPVETIVPVGHGAGVVALNGDAVAFAPLDYEQPIPEAVVTEYRRHRDPFAMTGSPPLPDGLNLGAQLFWLERLYPQQMAQAVLLPWAQYWAWFLTGRAVSEVTSLGCHSDLWSPARRGSSPMAERLGWARRFAPLAAAGEKIGTLRPEFAEATGLPGKAKVLAGVHDSNAALLAARGFPEIAANEATVLSTGTWF
ncbi:MAG: carbohydrate kinase, partial [Novosphingobium sp.]|nr:carbohydrate kinase [Novosphingobium sp.]